MGIGIEGKANNAVQYVVSDVGLQYSGRPGLQVVVSPHFVRKEHPASHALVSG